jgi:hypothetical protein
MQEIVVEVQASWSDMQEIVIEVQEITIEVQAFWSEM